MTRATCIGAWKWSSTESLLFCDGCVTIIAMSSFDVMQQLRAIGLSDGEVAARAGLARETVARWRSGAQKPSLDALEALVSAAGAQLEVRVVPADPEYIALVE